MPLAENQSDFFRVWNINVIMIRSRPEITQLFIFFTRNTRQMQNLMWICSPPIVGVDKL